MRDCKSTIQPVLDAIPSTFQIEAKVDYCVIHTPFRHPNDDFISLYIRDAWEDNFYISDFGKTYGQLKMYGVNVETESREKRLEKIRARFNLQESDAEIRLRVREENLLEGILEGIQAVQAVSYLMYTHMRREPSRFRETVSIYLEEHQYDFDTEVTISGSTHEPKFDFLINHRTPPVLIDTIHSTSEQYLQQQVDSVLLSWHEIKGAPYEHGVIIDDVEGLYSESRLNILNENLDYYIRWTEKGQLIEQIPVTPG